MDIKIRVAGAAGQGMQTTANLLGQTLVRAGLFVTSFVDAESRIRGGLNFSQLRISDHPTAGIATDYDVLIAHSTQAVKSFIKGLGNHGVLLGFSSSCDDGAAPVDLDELAKTAGNIKSSGVVAIGAVFALLHIPEEKALATIDRAFSKNENLLEINRRALASGYAAIGKWENAPEFPRIPTKQHLQKRMLLFGHQAISLGAIAGGVSFVAGYPMSPATSILADLAAWSKDAGIVVEQAEDEIAAINMLAGASYAGARSMTATSGGGFCLMTEGVSLLGMIETPGVIIIAQRPGPATGLPTRTAQGDLDLVLHAGHGFFPRIVLSPATVEDGFEITAKAFDLAERFQVPVFVLTDQLLQDSQSSVLPFDTSALAESRHLLTSKELSGIESYRRFLLTADGISPQAAPGSSEHVVVVDSDEHDELGHLSESPQIAQKMSKKRLRKAKTIEEQPSFAPSLIEGFSSEKAMEGKPLVLSWGSTYGTISEIRKNIPERHKFAHVHLRQLWPMDENAIQSLLQKASSVTVIENNTESQLAGQLRKAGLRPADNLITRHDGRPFDVDELRKKIQEVLS